MEHNLENVDKSGDNNIEPRSKEKIMTFLLEQNRRQDVFYGEHHFF